MSDLISRSALIEFVKEELKQDRPYDFKIKNIQRFIEDMPTAYDVEKVVAELEELANHYHKCCLVDYNEGAEVGVRESMAIVRKGGVE